MAPQSATRRARQHRTPGKIPFVTDLDPATDRSPVALEKVVAFLVPLLDEQASDLTRLDVSVLERRVEGRVRALGLSGYEEYLDHLQQHLGECTELFDSLRLDGPGRFRDEALWDRLGHHLVELLSCIAAPAPLRAWVAGCGTGGEAYSVVIAVAEKLGRDQTLERLQVYATDTDDLALQSARRGCFPRAALDVLPEPLRERYFDPTSDGLTFDPDLRRRIVFGRHDLLDDPPITRVDLLICLNVAMFASTGAQARLADRFHAALSDPGLLVLGNSESLFDPMRSFRRVDLRVPIFGKQPLPELPASREHLRPRDSHSGRFDATEVHQLREQLCRADRELQAAYDELRSSSEELETANNELQATVGELEISNAELHSTSQTLDVMNKELIDTNDELSAVNDELRERTAEVGRMHVFVGSVLDSFQAAVMVVDRDLRVQAWNERASELWGIPSHDAVGRSLSKLDVGLPLGELSLRLARVLTGRLADRAFEAVIADRRSHQLTSTIRCSPLRRADRSIDGAVVSVEPLE